MSELRRRHFARARAGTTLTELMVAVVILSVGVLGLFGAFSYITRSVFVSRTQTLATNLAQEKIETLKNLNYYGLLITTAAATDARFSPSITYDNGSYPPETITIAGIAFTRYTYVTMADMTNGVVTAVAYNYPDTGLKQITVNVIWTDNGTTKKWTLTNLQENPQVNPLDATISGSIAVAGGGGALAGARVRVEQNQAWSAVSASDGSYSFKVYHGTYTVRASSSGFADAISSATIVARNGVGTVNLSLVKITTGNVAGIVWYNPNLVVSQVVASTVQANTGADVEYVELFNPTTFPINIGSGGAASVNLNYGSENNESCANIPLVYVSTFVPPSNYYLIASSPSFMVNGVNVAADAYYNASFNHANCNPWGGNSWSAVGGYDIIQVNHSGLVWLTDASGNTIDSVGWMNGGTAPNGCSGHCSASCNGTCIPFQSPSSFPAGEQIVRISTPASALNAAATAGYGRAYNSQNNAADFYYPNPPSSAYQIAFQPKNVAAGSYPVVTGRVPAGVVVSAGDPNSTSLVPASVNIASGAYNLPYVPFLLTGVSTGTWSVAFSYGNYSQILTGVTVSQNATTPVPNAATAPAWLGAGLYHVQLSSTPSAAFVKGTVTDANNVPILNCPVTAGGSTKFTNSAGQYFMSVSSGALTIIANSNNYLNSYIQSAAPATVASGNTAVQNFVLSYGMKIAGYCTTGTTPVPNMTITATTGNNQAGSATSDGTGNFTITNIATGTYTVAPVLDIGQDSNPHSIAITATSTGTVFVGTFTASGAYGTISGSVTNGASAVTTGALIIASTQTIPNTPPTIVASSAPASTPYYMISSKADGTYSLPVRGASTYYLSAYVPITSGAGTVAITTKTYSNIFVNVAGSVTKNISLP